MTRKFGLWNFGQHGLADNAWGVGEIRARLDGENLDFLAVVETWRGRDVWLRRAECEVVGVDMPVQDTRSLFGDDYVWLEWNRQSFHPSGLRGDGGLGLLVRARVGEARVIREACVEDIMWVEVKEPAGIVWFLAVVYLRPGGKWAEWREKVRRALIAGVQRFSDKGKVVVQS